MSDMSLFQCCNSSQNKIRSCQSMIIMKQLSQQDSLGTDDLKEVNDSIEKGDHDGIINAIKKKNLPLWQCVNEEDINTNEGDRTLLRKLLEDSVNGNKVVRRLLDSYISETGDNEDAVDYRIQLDFSGVADETSPQQTHNCVFDLLKLKANRSSQAGAIQGNFLI